MSESSSSYLQAMLPIGQHLEIFEVRVLSPATALTWHFIVMDVIYLVFSGGQKNTCVCVDVM